MEDTTPEKTGLLSKRQEDLTVGDSLKIVVAATAITAVVPIVMFSAALGLEKLASWRKARKDRKAFDQENNIIEASVVES